MSRCNKKQLAGPGYQDVCGAADSQTHAQQHTAGEKNLWNVYCELCFLELTVSTRTGLPPVRDGKHKAKHPGFGGRDILGKVFQPLPLSEKIFKPVNGRKFSFAHVDLAQKMRGGDTLALCRSLSVPVPVDQIPVADVYVLF